MHNDPSFRFACGGSLAMAAALGIGRFVYTPILPVMLDGLHWSKTEAGFVAASNFLGYLIGAVVAARQIRPGRQRWALIVALLISALTTGGMAVPHNLAILMVLRLLGGATSAFVIVLASTLVLARLTGARHRYLSAVHFGGVGAGIMVSAAAVSVLLAFGAGWQALWVGAGVIALLATAFVAVLIPEQQGVQSSPSMPVAAPPQRRLLMLIVAYGLFGFGYIITATFLVTMVRLSPELRTLEAWIWILFGFAAIPSVALWSWVGDRIGLIKAFVIACLVEAVGIAAGMEWVSASGVCVSTILLGATFMGITALGLMAARQLSGAGAQRAIGLMTASFASGQVVGPAIGGVVFDRFGSLQVAAGMSAVALVAAAGLAVLASSDGTTRGFNPHRD
jgi:predicted MFS family arabinose efflux permease